MKAILPAAGKGTRLLPLSGIMPKEVVPIGPNICIGHVFHELAEAGVKDVTVIFSYDKAWAKEIVAKAAAASSVGLYWVDEVSPRGPVSGILLCEEWAASEDTIIAFPDCLIVNKQSRTMSSPHAIMRLVRAHQRYGLDCTFLCKRSLGCGNSEVVLPYFDAAAMRYGMPPSLQRVVARKIESDSITLRMLKLDASVDAGPVATPGITPAARWVLGKKAWTHLHGLSPRGTEFLLSDVVHSLVVAGAAVGCVELETNEECADIGTWNSLYEAWSLMREFHIK